MCEIAIPAVTPKDTVLDVNELQLPERIYDALADGFEVLNRSIVRYFPDMTYSFLPAPDQVLLHQAMARIGVVFPAVLSRAVDHPDGYYSYSLLLEFSW